MPTNGDDDIIEAEFVADLPQQQRQPNTFIQSLCGRLDAHRQAFDTKSRIIVKDAETREVVANTRFLQAKGDYTRLRLELETELLNLDRKRRIARRAHALEVAKGYMTFEERMKVCERQMQLLMSERAVAVLQAQIRAIESGKVDAFSLPESLSGETAAIPPNAVETARAADDLREVAKRYAFWLAGVAVDQRPAAFDKMADELLAQHYSENEVAIISREVTNLLAKYAPF
jgi:hypothetical protein